MTVPEFQQMLSKVGSDFLRYKRWMDIEDKLLSPYPSVPPECLAECHIGHLLHGLVKLAKTYCDTQFWCDKICIVDVSSPRALGALNLEEIDLILGIVASKSHWALVACHRKLDAMVLYDGKDNQIVRSNALIFKQKLEDLGAELRLQIAKCPRQVDEWSCGHRVLLAAKEVLKRVFKESPLGLPFELPHDFAHPCQMEALKSLWSEPRAEKKEELTDDDDEKHGGPKPMDDCRQEDHSRPVARLSQD